MLTDSHKTNLLLALGAGLILSDIIPTPADAIYFGVRELINKNLKKKK